MMKERGRIAAVSDRVITAATTDARMGAATATGSFIMSRSLARIAVPDKTARIKASALKLSSAERVINKAKRVMARGIFLSAVTKRKMAQATSRPPATTECLIPLSRK